MVCLGISASQDKKFQSVFILITQREARDLQCTGACWTIQDRSGGVGWQGESGSSNPTGLEFTKERSGSRACKWAGSCHF